MLDDLRRLVPLSVTVLAFSRAAASACARQVGQARDATATNHDYDARVDASAAGEASAVSRVLAHARVHAPWRRVLSGRSVHRVVQGVGLWMPWSHRLPDYAALRPSYGQNLVDLTALLVSADSSVALQIVDVGANIGDSTKQIMKRAYAQVLAIEGDSYYLPYLHRNVGDQPGVTIAPVLLTTTPANDTHWRPSRRGGTTQFHQRAASARPGMSGHTQRTAAQTSVLMVNQLPAAYPEFSDVRLIKSDTDGHDTELIVALATVYRSTRPVLFFEYDPVLTRTVSHTEADLVWAALAGLGYVQIGFWSNHGVGLGRVGVEDAAETAASLLRAADRRVAYLDAAAVHADDAVGQAAVESLIGEPKVVGA